MQWVSILFSSTLMFIRKHYMLKIAIRFFVTLLLVLQIVLCEHSIFQENRDFWWFLQWQSDLFLYPLHCFCLNNMFFDRHITWAYKNVVYHKVIHQHHHHGGLVSSFHHQKKIISLLSRHSSPLIRYFTGEKL